MELFTSFFSENGAIMVVVLSVWRLIDAIAKLTPTNADNEVLDTLGRVFRALGGKK